MPRAGRAPAWKRCQQQGYATPGGRPHLNTSAVSWNSPSDMAEMPSRRCRPYVDTLVPVASLTALQRGEKGRALRQQRRQHAAPTATAASQRAGPWARRARLGQAGQMGATREGGRGGGAADTAHAGAPAAGWHWHAKLRVRAD